MSETRVFRFSKAPGPYKGWVEDRPGADVVFGKRGEVAENMKARAAALQATGVSAVVEEVDEQGRVIHTFPFYGVGPPDEGSTLSTWEDDAAKAKAEAGAEQEAKADTEEREREGDAYEEEEGF